MTQEKHQIFLAVESVMVQEALEALLRGAGINVAGKAAGAWLDGMAPKPSELPGLVVLDSSLGHTRVLEMGRACNRQSPGVSWLVLADPSEDLDVFTVLREGARGYVWKTQPGAEMVAAVQSVLRGGLYLNPTVLSTVIPRLLANSGSCEACISALDRELLKAIADGRSITEMAAMLGLAAGELRLKRRELESQLGVRNTAGLVRYAVRHRIVKA